MKKALIISYFFPPASSTGGTRPLKFVKYLRDFGWEPTVLTVKHSFDYGVPEDNELLKEIPSGVSVYRTFSFEPLNWYWNWRTQSGKKLHTKKKEAKQGEGVSLPKKSLKQVLIDLFHIPDRYCGWILFGVVRGLLVIHKEKPDVIFATTPCPSALVIGYVLSKISRCPLIVDYRDPWTDSCAGFKKELFIAKIHQFLERCILNHAQKIICVSQTRLAELLGKYQISEDKGCVITNGYDKSDLIGFEVSQKKSVYPLTFIHPGQIYQQSGVSEFLQALNELLDEGFIEPKKILVQFVGSVPQGKVFEDLQNKGVCTYLPRMSKKEVLKLMGRADVFLLFLGDSVWSRGWIVSKIFDCMLFNKPVLGVVPEGETADIIKSCEMGDVVGHDKNKAKEVLKDIYSRYDKQELMCHFNDNINDYDRRLLTKKLSDVFDQIIKKDR